MVLIRRGNGWERASLRNYDDEATLQAMLAENPELIPGCTGSLVAREFTISGVGLLDLLCVDQNGTLTLVECKLAKNPEIRRSIVGQVFAYASGLEGTSLTEFEARLQDRTGQPLIEALEAATGDEIDATALRTNLTETLREGRFRLVIAIDEITDELKAIVEYLNRHLAETVSICALELGLLQVDQTEILIPSTYGQEIAEQRTKTKPTHRWTREAIDAGVEELPSGPAKTLLQDLLSHVDANGAVVKGGEGAAVSAGFYYQINGDRRSLWSLYLKDAGPTVTVNLWSILQASEPVARDVLAVLRQHPEVDAALPVDDDEALQKYAGFPLASLTDKDGATRTIRTAITTAADTG